MTTPGPDVSVRVAWTDDAEAIAEVQLRAWHESWSGIVPAESLPTDPGQLAPGWHEALARPGDARNRVLVALERNRIVGFVLTSPATDPDCDPVANGEVSELTVDPVRRREGHGSRLLQAAVDTMQADKFIRAVAWVVTTDDALRGFLTSAGWAPDSAHRELAMEEDGAHLKQVRLHTALA